MQLRSDLKLIGQAPIFLDTLRQIATISRIDAPVLIEGETGTGKELAARAMHYSGPRAAMAFIPVNCGALPESLVENELFGHCRGAYTDAREPQQGLIAQAQGGTLFLDEIDALPYRGQVALLRFLQDWHYRPLGAAQDRQANVRVIAATNLDLEQLAKQRQFRADLLYRLKIFSVTLPPLRSRSGDIELLASHFATAFSRQYAIASKPIASTDLDWMRNYSWPGNVRELESLLHRAVVQSQGKSHVEVEINTSAPTHPEAGRPTTAAWEPKFQRAKAAAVQAFERNFIERTLLQCAGNVSAAARLSGKERRAFGRLMKKHGFDKHQYRL